MSVTTDTRFVSYDADGVETDFDVTFPFLADGDLQVHTVDAGVATEATLGVDYTVVGAGTTDGGTVSFLTAPASGLVVTIERTVAETQPTSYRSVGSVFPETVESSLDRQAMLSQQISAASKKFAAFTCTSATLAALATPTGAYHQQVACVKDVGAAEVYKICVLEDDGITYSWQTIFTSPV